MRGSRPEPRWGFRVSGIALATLLALTLGGCKSAPKTPYANQSGESLLSILNEIQLARGRDVYRMPYPVDVEGKNLFTASLSRIDNWSRLHPGEFQDIVWFSRGMCHEKLAHLEDARTAYLAVDSSDANLERSAGERARVMEELLEALRPPTSATGEVEFSPEEAALEREQRAINKYRGTEYESVVLLCVENVAVQKANDLRSSREPGSRTAYKAAVEELVVRFEESKRIYQHWMRLGMFHEDIMREWIVQAEYGGDPKAWKLAQDSLKKAEEIYWRVSRADGYTEKREAQARVELLEEAAFKIEKNLS